MCIPLISDVVDIIATIILTILGIYGITQWRRETRGKTKYELARNIAKEALHFREQLIYVRSPFTWLGESADRPRQENESVAEQTVRDEAYARTERLNQLRETTLRLAELRWEAAVTLNEEVATLINDVEAIYSDLARAMNTYFNGRLTEIERGSNNIIPADIDDAPYNKVYGTETDEYGLEATNTINTLTDALKAFIGK